MLVVLVVVVLLLVLVVLVVMVGFLGVLVVVGPHLSFLTSLFFFLSPPQKVTSLLAKAEAKPNKIPLEGAPKLT